MNIHKQCWVIHSRRVVVSYKQEYVHELLVNCLFKPAQEKSVVRLTDRPAMTIAVDLGCKATKQTNKQTMHTVMVYKDRAFCHIAVHYPCNKLLLFYAQLN